MLAAILDWIVALVQSALLVGPACWLSARTAATAGPGRAGSMGPAGREKGTWFSSERIIHTTLWAAGLIYLNYLLSLAIGIYTWPVAVALHAATVGLCFFCTRLLPPGGHASATHAFRAPKLRRALEERPLLRLVFFAVLSAVGTGLVLNLRTPPGGWDALTYHLDFPAQWALAGEIFPAITAYGDYSPTYYPMLVEAFAGWFLLPLRGAAFADLIQLFFAPLLYCALRDLSYYYASRLSVDPGLTGNEAPARTTAEISPIAEYAPLLILSLPYLQSSLLVADNDFVLCALLLAAWRGAVLQGPHWRSIASLSMAIPAALALTVKYTGLVFVGALSAALILIILIDALLRNSPPAPRKSKGDTHATSAVGHSRSPGDRIARPAAFFLILLFGASPYLINWWTTGNPLYPATVEVSGFRLFDGYYPREFFLEHPFHRFDWTAFLTDPGLSLPVWFFLAGIAGAAIALAPFRMRDERTAMAMRTLASLALVPIALFCAFYFFVPLRQFRLLTPAMVCCGPALVAFAVIRTRFADKSRIRRLAAAIPGLACTGAIGLHCATTALRFADVYGDPLPFALHIGLSEIARSTAPQILRDAPAAGMAFIAVVLIGLAAGLAAFHFARCRRCRIVMLLAGVLSLSLPAAFAFEQQFVSYDGPGLPAAYRAIAALRAGETPANWKAKPDATGAPTIRGGIGVIGTNALLPFRARRPDRPPIALPDAGGEIDGDRKAGRVYLMLNRPHGDRPLHLREESLRYDPETRAWLAIGTLASRELFKKNLERYYIRALILASTIGTNGKWPAEYEWLHDQPNSWHCGLELSNAISGDPGARIAVCVRL